MNKPTETQMNVLNEYFNMIKKHDYSYMYSDDNRWYMSGSESEIAIKEQISLLCDVIGFDAERLLEDSLYEVNEQYIDGLTHRTIRNWFKPFVLNVDDIFVKPNFE